MARISTSSFAHVDGDHNSVDGAGSTSFPGPIVDEQTALVQVQL